MARVFILCIGCLFAYTIMLPEVSLAETQREPIRIGWIGAMTGPVSKYGAYQSALIALEDINSDGGIGGRPLELIFEDGKCNGRAAVDAANKLIQVDRVRYILGGHCTPESLPVAPIAERNKVIMLAAITSNPMLTSAGDYIFRATPVSTQAAEKLAPYMLDNLKLKKLGLLYEETDYVRPVAERLAELFTFGGGTVSIKENFLPGESDFRSSLSKLRHAGIDSIYVGVQAPETAALLFTQLHDLGLASAVFSNEAGANAITSFDIRKDAVEGMVYAEPAFDVEDPNVKVFVDKFKTRFKVDKLPMGIWTAEAYDTVRLLASLIEKCGDDVELVKKCLYEVRDYKGVSGSISIDGNGDGQRNYILKVIRNGSAQPLSERSPANISN